MDLGDVIGVLIVLAVLAFLGSQLWNASHEGNIDAQAMYDDMILKDYEQEESSGQVRPTPNQDEGS